MLGFNKINIRLIGSGSTPTNCPSLHCRRDESVSLLSRQTLEGSCDCLACARLQTLLSRRGSLSQWRSACCSSCWSSRRPAVARPVEECEGNAGCQTDLLSPSKAPRCRVHTWGLGREEEWAHLARIRWMKRPSFSSSTWSAVKSPDCSIRARSVHLLLPSTSSSTSSSSTIIPETMTIKHLLVCISEHFQSRSRLASSSPNNLFLLVDTIASS